MAQSPENKEKEQRGQVAGTEGGEGLFRCPTPQRTACGLRKPGCLHLKLCVGTAVRTRMGAGGVIFKDSPDIHFTGRETSHHEAEPVLEHSDRSFWHEKLLFSFPLEGVVTRGWMSVSINEAVHMDSVCVLFT